MTDEIVLKVSRPVDVKTEFTHFRNDVDYDMEAKKLLLLMYRHLPGGTVDHFIKMLEHYTYSGVDDLQTSLELAGGAAMTSILGDDDLD